MTPTQQWGIQVAAAAVCGWALGNLLVEVAAAGVAAAWRVARRKGAPSSTGP